MARVTKIIEVCDRDAFGREKPFTEVRRFSVDDNAYILKLCDQHAEMFDRDMMGWMRVAADDDTRQRAPSFFTRAQVEADRKAAQLRAVQTLPPSDRTDDHTNHTDPVYIVGDSDDSDPGDTAAAISAVVSVPQAGEGWYLTQHAKDQAAERGFTEAEMLSAADRPEWTYTNPEEYDPGTMIHVRNGCAVSVNRAQRRIITVLPRDAAHHHEYTPMPHQSIPSKVRIAQ